MEHIKTRTIAKNYHSVLFNVASLIRNVPWNKTRSLKETNWKVCQEFVQKPFIMLLIHISREVGWGWVSSSTILRRNVYCQIRNDNQTNLISSIYVSEMLCRWYYLLCSNRNLSSRNAYYNLIHIQK